MTFRRNNHVIVHMNIISAFEQLQKWPPKYLHTYMYMYTPGLIKA